MTCNHPEIQSKYHRKILALVIVQMLSLQDVIIRSLFSCILLSCLLEIVSVNIIIKSLRLTTQQAPWAMSIFMDEKKLFGI